MAWALLTGSEKAASSRVPHRSPSAFLLLAACSCPGARLTPPQANTPLGGRAAPWLHPASPGIALGSGRTLLSPLLAIVPFCSPAGSIPKV